MYKLLRDFEPSKPNISFDKMAAPTAGFHLVSCLLQPSELLRLILLTLNDYYLKSLLPPFDDRCTVPARRPPPDASHERFRTQRALGGRPASPPV